MIEIETKKNAIGHQLPEPGELSAEQTEGLFYRYKTEMRIHGSSEFRGFHQGLKMLELGRNSLFHSL